MSHIYDALKKSQGGEPPQPRDPEQGGPPPAPPAPRPTAQDGDAPRRIEPEARIDDGLLGQPHVELFRQLESLRESLEMQLGGARRRVVGLTGSLPGEGASTLALNLAHLLARVGEKRTLLIDGDLAGATVSLSQALGERQGLTELMRSDLPLSRLILATSEPNLHFLPAGLDRVHHAAAVSAGTLRPLFERLSQHYDAIVVDIAPVLEHPEAPFIGAACDGVVLVVRAGETRRELAQRAIAELNYSRCRILGTVLNGQKHNLPTFLRERV